MAQTPETPSTPVATYRYGNISAAVFTKQVKNEVGETFDVHNVTVRRSYRTSDGEWVHTHTLRKSDLLPASVALGKCYDFISNGESVVEE